MYILTAWTDLAETTVRSGNPKIILRRAHELVAAGMRISIVRTKTGESIAISEVETEALRKSALVHGADEDQSTGAAPPA